MRLDYELALFGQALSDLEVDRWLQRLPLRIVADLWGLSVQTYNGDSDAHLGCSLNSLDCSSIAIGVKNLSTWAHELVHVADFRNGTMIEPVPHWRMETVAEFGGAVLLKLLGYHQEADLGGCWRYIHHYVGPKKIGVVRACNLVLERACGAVNLILNTAHEFKKELLWEKFAC
jgi:hypothetical protein